MTDYLTLTCPSCGAKLEETPDIGKFTCPYCGQVHMLYQEQIIDELKSLVADLKTIADSADDEETDPITRQINSEIEELKNRKNQIMLMTPRPEGDYVIAVIGIGAILLIIMCLDLLIFWRFDLWHWIFLLSGLLMVVIGVIGWQVTNKKNYDWDIIVEPKIRELDEQIELKRIELWDLYEDGK